MDCSQVDQTAFVYPGQGSQRAGMGRDFCDRFAVSRDTFAEASDAIGVDLAALCFDGDARLDLTEFTQPAILTTEIAMLRALDQELGLSATWHGGHSLGEYTALCAAGVIPFADAVRIVRRRGALMQRAVPADAGAMSAVLAHEIAHRDLVADIAGIDVDVANLNSRDQVVLSGAALAVSAAGARFRELLAGTPHEVIALNVSAPFHSRLMRGIEAEFRAELLEAAPRLCPERAVAVTSNFTGRFHEGTLAALVDALVRQISGSVDWIGNMRALMAKASRIIEVGPHRPLRAFFKSAGRDITSIISVKTAEKERAA